MSLHLIFHLLTFLEVPSLKERQNKFILNAILKERQMNFKRNLYPTAYCHYNTGRKMEKVFPHIQLKALICSL
jgi:hypothetical protein